MRLKTKYFKGDEKLEKLKGYIKEEDLKNPLKSTAKDITINNSKFTSKNVEGALEELFTNVDNGKDNLYSAIVDKKVTPKGKDFKDLTNAVNNIKLGQGNAQSGDVLQGKTFTNDSGIIQSGSMANYGSKIITPSKYVQESGNGYYDKVKVNPISTTILQNNFPELKSKYIKEGINIGGVIGTAKVVTSQSGEIDIGDVGEETVTKEITFDDFGHYYLRITGTYESYPYSPHIKTLTITNGFRSEEKMIFQTNSTKTFIDIEIISYKGSIKFTVHKNNNYINKTKLKLEYFIQYY